MMHDKAEKNGDDDDVTVICHILMDTMMMHTVLTHTQV